MAFWQRLLIPDAPADTTLESAALVWRGPFPWWVALLIGLALAAVVVWFYLSERVRLGLFRRVALIGLRILLLALVLFLLLRPTIVATFHGERPRGIVLLIDNSQSMTLKDRRLTPDDRKRVALAFQQEAGKIPEDPSRADIVRAILSDAELSLRGGLATKGPLRVYLFGEGVTLLPGQPSDKEALPGFDAKQPRTALADAVRKVLQNNEAEPPAAIVVLTDGRDNASAALLDDVARECFQAGTALHVFGAGSSQSGLLQIREFALPDTIFPEDTVAVPVRWRSRGLKQGTVEIVLRLEGREVARREVPVREGDVEEILAFSPTKEDARPDRSKLTVQVKLKDQPAYQDQAEKPVRVEDRKVRVLVIENAPRWEYKFLQMNLLRDRRVEARFLLASGAPEAMASGNPFLPSFPSVKELRSFDLLILGDVPASWLGAERIKQIEEFVKEGGGLVQIAGRQHAPASFAGTPLAEVLPVEFQARRFPPDPDARPQPFQPLLTRAGERSPMLTLAETLDDNRKAWKDLAPIYWHYPVTKLRPGAQALLVHPKAKSETEPMPLAAVHYYGKGLVLFLASDETWRWRYNTQDSVFGRFWGQVVYQLGMRRRPGQAQSHLALESGDVTAGERGHVYARLFDANFRPLTVERIDATLKQLEGPDEKRAPRTVTLEAIPGLPGEYRALLVHDRVGKFALELPASQGGAIEYRVDLPPQHELTEEGMNEPALREAARLSGGRFYQEEDLYRLVESVETKKAPYTDRREALLWNWASLLVFVLLITAEWVVRKFSNLS